jgi:hypothetical protein
MNENYNYNQYLEQWEDHFGNAPQGDFVYRHFGQRKIKTLPKMSKRQFVQTLERYNNLSPEIDKLQSRPDYSTNDAIGKQVDDLMAKCFKCELPLFF